MAHHHPKMESVIFARIEREIGASDVVLYMRGTAVFPQCGPSATVVQILSSLGVPFKDVNVTSDGELRRGIRDYANWPVLPQLYIKGNFVGGANIVREMYQTGELQEMLRLHGLIASGDRTVRQEGGS